MRPEVIVFFLLFALVSCQKVDNPVESHNSGSLSGPGSISGVQSPPGQSSTIVATPDTGTIYAVTPGTYGEIKIDSMTPGSYIISIVPPNVTSQHNLQPKGIQVKVEAGKKVNLDTVFMPFPAFTGTVACTGSISYYAIGSLTQPNFACTYNGSDFYLVFHQNPNDITVSMALSNVADTGTYLLGNTINSSIRIQKFNGPANIQAWSTLKGGSGMIRIIMIDTVSKTCSGTFTVSAVAENKFTTGTQAISNGSFTGVNYE